MNRLLPAALLVLTLAPQAAAAAAPVSYPPALVDLAHAWIAEAEAKGAPYAGRAWYPDAEAYLERARAAGAEGRFRLVTFHLETFHELLLAHALLDESADRSDGERKTYVLQRTAVWHEEARQAWEDYRAKLHGMEDELRSLHSLELALYASDHALMGALLLAEHPAYAREFSKQPLDVGLAVGLVRTSHTGLLAIGRASDMLDVLAQLEGLPPRIREETWNATRAVALRPVDRAQLSPPYQPYEDLAAPVREAGEGTLAVAFHLAERRVGRLTGIQLIFGDAASRGENTTAAAIRGIRGALANVSQQDDRDVGLLGVSTADAVDAASYALELGEAGRLGFDTMVVSWAGLDHARYVREALTPVSPVRPADAIESPKGTAGAGSAFALAAVAAAARLARHGRR